MHKSIIVFLMFCLCQLLPGGEAFASDDRVHLVISEIMSSNGSTLSDEDDEYEDWIELHNTGKSAVELTGFGLSDDSDEPRKWVFKGGHLDPGEFLIVFASGKDRQLVERSQTLALQPAEIPNLALWLDAGKIDTNDVVQTRNSGGRSFIRSWLDQSGNRLNLNQLNEDEQPELIYQAIGGLPAVKFPGSWAGLYQDAIYGGKLAASNQVTAYIVQKYYSRSGPHCLDHETQKLS